MAYSISDRHFSLFNCNLNLLVANSADPSFDIIEELVRALLLGFLLVWSRFNINCILRGLKETY